MSQPHVRFATKADAAVAAQLLAAQLIEHHLPADPVGIAYGIDLALAPHSPAWLVLAERDGKAVGVSLVNKIVSVEKGGLALWMEELYVVPDARRTGVASAILRFLVDEGRRAGLRSLDLEVVRTQAAAFALYRAFGFVDVDRARLSLPISST